jgi:undecaprenyl-diphosphatase
MQLIHAIILGIVEGFTEFLPISSTGHLTIAEKLMGYSIDDRSITAFTAIIQIGAILAAIIYFRKDIIRLVVAWWSGLWFPAKRRTHDYLYGWAIIIGSMPVAIVGFVFRDQIETVFRSLWVVAGALILWSFVLWIADRMGKAKRKEEQVTWKDTLFMGIAQCFALIPGVSRSGATISAGLIKGLDRVAVTKLSFFLGIPALTAAGIFQAVTQYHYVDDSVGWGPTIVATIVSFIVGYISIAWLLKFVASNNFSVFIWYRIGLGLLLIVLLATGVVAAV